LPTGKVLLFSNESGDERTVTDAPRGQGNVWSHQNTQYIIFDPVSNSTSPVMYNNTGTELFCSGHAFDSSGNLIISGGHNGQDLSKDIYGVRKYAHRFYGVSDANKYDPFTQAWSRLPSMNGKRWYPTNIELPSGEIATVAGSHVNWADIQVPEVWNGSSWRRLDSANYTSNHIMQEIASPFLKPTQDIYITLNYM
jgi:hypothetical protein